MLGVMSDYDKSDWDDHLEPDARSRVMNETARRMGLTPRYGDPAPGNRNAHFGDGALEGRAINGTHAPDPESYRPDKKPSKGPRSPGPTANLQAMPKPATKNTEHVSLTADISRPEQITRKKGIRNG